MGGQEFGKLWFIRNIVYIRVSSFELNAFANFWKNTWRGFKRDTVNNAWWILPIPIAFYSIYSWGKAVNEQTKRKNPKDYENDE